MAASIDEEYSCGYCLSKKEEMVDAKKLPCGHIFCLNCLLHDYQNSPKVKCICCTKEFENLDVQMLESCYFEKNIPCCDVCGTNSKADIWCIACSKNMCKEHAEVHDSFMKQFGFVHKTELSSAQSKPTTISERPLCIMHSKAVEGACSQCQSLLCFKCLTDSKCTQSICKCHSASDIQKLSECYKVSMNKMMQDLLNKITEIAEMEKKAYRGLSKKKMKCDTMKEMVDKVLQEQNALMKLKAEKIKLDIDVYYDDCTSRVSDYVKSLTFDIDEIDQIRKDIHELKQKTDWDVILKNNEIKAKSAEALGKRKSLPYRECKLQSKVDIEKEIEAPNQLKEQIKKLEQRVTEVENKERYCKHGHKMT